MNRLYIGAAVTAVAVSISAVSVFAADSSVTVQVDTKNMTYSYTPGNEENTKSVKNLFSNFEDATVSESVDSELTITSDSDNGEDVEFGLRLSIDEADENAEYSVLDYYTFKITDTAGNVIYDSAESEPTEVSALVKDIPLGVFNTDFTEDTKKYIIECGVNKEVADAVGSNAVDDMDILLTTSLYTNEAATQPAATPSAGTVTPGAGPTLKPQFELSATDVPSTVAPAETATPAPTETASTSPAPTEAPKEKKIICGEDIDPGRYTVTGNANVRITTADGKMISETTVTDGTHEDVKGVKQFITSLEKGDVITITPISDGIKASVNFEKTNTGSSTDTKSTTAASSTSNKKSSSKATATPRASSKTNPKTGDAGLTTTILGSIMGVSAAAAGSLEVVKRRKKSDK